MGASYRLDELSVGDVFDSFGKTVTEAEMLDFAFRYDPQPVLMDVTAAEAGRARGLAASPFLVLLLAWRLVQDLGLFQSTLLGLIGMEEVQVLRPLRAGQSLRARLEVLSLEPAQTRADRGYARMRLTALVGGVPVAAASLTLLLERAAEG